MENGFIYVTNYSEKFRNLIISICEKAQINVGLTSLKGIGVFLFGSPSRQEMVEESDADIMIIRDEDNEDYFKFRTEFEKLLINENFPKLDLPEWGNLKDCETYIRDSITEGNQIIEAKFIYGDFEVDKKVVILKNKYCTSDKFERILCFQKLYFDQYYKQRTRGTIKNVKYGHGGTRDFMFITWFSNLLDINENKKINFEDNFPHTYKSLSHLYSRKLINFEEYIKFCKDVKIVLLLRNQVLINNKGSEDEGLTYLDDRTLKRLQQTGQFANMFDTMKELKIYLEKAVSNVKTLKDCIWKNYLDFLTKTKGFEWHNRFIKILKGEVTKDLIEQVDEEDILTKIAILWNINPKKDGKLFYELFDKYSKSHSWEILTSLCCHVNCPAEVIDTIVKNKAMVKGYEYILRVSSRNKNVSGKTLLRIMNNPYLEERFKIVAKTTYEKRVKKANEFR